MNGMTKNEWFYERDREKLKIKLNKILLERINTKKKECDYER